MSEMKAASAARRKAADKKGPKEPKSDLNPQPSKEETNGKSEPKAEPAKKARPPRKPREPKEEREPMVVFAFRLSADERELIHRAAGPARASRFVRALAIAAACDDRKAIHTLLDNVKVARGE